MDSRDSREARGQTRVNEGGVQKPKGTGKQQSTASCYGNLRASLLPQGLCTCCPCRLGFCCCFVFLVISSSEAVLTSPFRTPASPGPSVFSLLYLANILPWVCSARAHSD